MLPRTVGILVAGLLLLLVTVGIYIYTNSNKTEGFADDSGLPQGWNVANDAIDGKLYYYNTSTGLTQWEKPTDPAPTDLVPSDTKEGDLPQGWSVANDSIDGKPYYFTSTGFTQWEKPTDPAPTDLAPSDQVQTDLAPSDQVQTDPVLSGKNEGDLPQGWSVSNDVDGKPYYFTSTGLTQWEKPTEPAAATPQVENTPASENKGPSQVPKNTDPSLMTNAIPGSTTSNSNETLASFADLGALMEAIKTFKTYYDLNIINASKDPGYFDLNNSSVGHMIAIQNQMASGIIIDNYNYITDLRIAYEKASKDLKQKSRSTESPIEDKKLSDGNSVKVKDIEMVIERTINEKNLLTSIRSEDPVTQKRLANLLKIISDMNDLLDRIKRGKIDIKDVPFSKNDLRVLYSDIKNTKKSDVKSITTPEVNNKVANKNTLTENGLALDKNYGDLLGSYMKDLSWDIRVAYNPEVTLKRNILDRIDTIKGDLKAGRLTEDQIKDKLLELNIVKQKQSSENSRLVTRSEKALKPYNKTDYADAKEGYQPTPVEFTNGAKIIQSTSFNDNMSQDWLSRPGYDMTNERIKTRGSDSSFDPTTVGGPDYFQRAQFLCNQISDAGLGTPSEFGCIDGKAVVSPEYSWKGNYLMVCSRLGTVWGGWYPEMFGCPSSQNSELQMPNKKIDRI